MGNSNYQEERPKKGKLTNKRKILKIRPFYTNRANFNAPENHFGCENFSS